ncbi:hypothetical protein Tco_0993822 [Tanacetum coccineum]
MQTEEQEQLSIEEKSKLFVELLEKRKKHFTALRAQEKRSKPPTKAQKRNTMSSYLKNMVGYKHNQLKSKSYDEIQEMFDKEMKRVNTFVDMNTKLVKSSETRTEGSSKRAGDELESDNSKKQKIEEHVEAKKDDDQEEAEMKKHIEIVKDDEVAIDVIPLATKPPVIVKYKIVKEGKFVYFQLIRANRSSKRYLSMIKMLQNIDREDLEILWKLVKVKHGNTRPEDEYERILQVTFMSKIVTDKVIHIVEIDIVKLVVEIDSFGMSVDEFDKETGSSDGLQPKQADLSCIHALNELHLHEIHDFLSKYCHEVDQCSCVQITNQIDICHKFAPLRRKSIQKLGVHLNYFQFHIVDVHVIAEQ